MKEQILGPRTSFVVPRTPPPEKGKHLVVPGLGQRGGRARESGCHRAKLLLAPLEGRASGASEAGVRSYEGSPRILS